MRSSVCRFVSVVLFFTVVLCVGIVAAALPTGPASAASSGTLLWPSEAPVRPVRSLDQLLSALRRSDEISVFYAYDSADVNSHEAIPGFRTAATPLSGFASFYAVDMRDDFSRWVLDAWGVQVVPAIRAMAPGGMHREQWQRTPLAGVGGLREAVEFPVQEPVTEASLKRFVLARQGNAAPITKLDRDAKVTQLHEMLVNKGADQVGASVVLLSSKGASTPLYKALAIRFAGRAEFYEVNVAKAPLAKKLFAAENTPTLLLFDEHGNRHEFRGALNYDELATFVGPHVPGRELRAHHKLHQDELLLKRHSQRQTTPILRVASPEEWATDVVDRQSVSGVFFVSSEEEGEALIPFVRAFRSLSKERGAIGQYVYVVEKDAPELVRRLAHPEGEEPASLVFISAKKGVFTRYLGDPTAPENVLHFVNGPLSRGVGSHQLGPNGLDFA